MVITDKFVYIHMAKTGGTFVEWVLAKLFAKTSRVYIDTATEEGKRQLPELFYHSGMRRLSDIHRRKKILFSIRNPYDYYVSRYEYPAEYLPYGIFYEKRIKKLYPHYPNLAFGEYLKAINDWELRLLRPRPDRQSHPRLCAESNIGNMSWIFIQLLFKEPYKIIKNLDGYARTHEYREGLPDVHFVSTDNLNRDLYDFLLSMGYAARKLDFILELGKIYPPQGGRDESQSWQKYYTPELRKHVREKDRFIFNMFPVYDI